MSQTMSYCLERAEQSAEDARVALLENVRERALRSEEAWRKMADRADKLEQNRARKAIRPDTFTVE